MLFVNYVLAFLATNAPPHRPLHHNKPINTTSSIMSVKSAVKHSVHHPPANTSASVTSATSVGSAAAKLERVKHAQGQAKVQAKAQAAVDPSKSSSARQNSLRATNQASK